MRLNSSHKVLRLAADLGLRPEGDVVGQILGFAKKRAAKLLAGLGQRRTPSELLSTLVTQLDTTLEIIESDGDLAAMRTRYVQEGEKAFACLDRDLAASDVFGITLRRTNRQPCDREFVSVIDCRGPKSYRRYFTKWHELAHLLILTDQLRLEFRRTHCSNDTKDPEEQVVDIIAGYFAYPPEMVRRMASGEISFDRIEAIRSELCPEASWQASLIGIVKGWPAPCLLVRAEMGFRRSEGLALRQRSFDFLEQPTAALRALEVIPNDEARRLGLSIHANMRVPERSVIARVFGGEGRIGAAMEDLSWWTSSDGGRLNERQVKVQAMRSGDSAYALIMPQH